jgi:hypothetical protein
MLRIATDVLLRIFGPWDHHAVGLPDQRRPSGSPPFWRPGEVIAWWYGEFDAFPMTVVEDGPDRLVAWLADGTPILTKVRMDGRPQRADKGTMFTAPMRQVEDVWRRHDMLRIHRTGEWWSTWVCFAATGEFVGWYCNIEDPHVRDHRATYSRDHVLDVWVEPDRSVRLKDEDELVLAVEQGR